MIEVSSFTTSPNEAAAIEEINAIYDYVRGVRATAADHAGALDIIQRFEAWYQGLEESAKVGLITHVVNQADVNEAKRRREELKDAIGAHLPDDYKPADAPQTSPKGPDYEQGKNPPDDPLTTALKVGGAVAIGYVLYKIFT